MAVSLEQIVAATRRRVAESRREADLRGLEERAQQHSPRGFRQALESKSRTGIAIIAELKKASPSRGLIRADFNPGGLARELQEAGAAALSILTGAGSRSGLASPRLPKSQSLPCHRSL